MNSKKGARHISVTPDASPDASQTGTTRPFYDKSWALVIGINEYQGAHARLSNARNDAQAMARVLAQDYHFDGVFTLYDAEATRDAILGWLRDDLPQRVGDNDRLVFFFAGHGTTRKGGAGQERGYLIPQDAEIGKYRYYIDMDEVRDACGWISAKHIFIILDCCFSGISAYAVRSTPPPAPATPNDAYLADITRRRAWQVLTAGASDQLVADSGSRPGHSAFTGALLTGLEGGADADGDGIITASDLASYIRPIVSRESARGGAGQNPFFNHLAGSEMGDFVFARTQKPRAPKAVPQAPTIAIAPTQNQGLNTPVQAAKRTIPTWGWVAAIALILLVAGRLGWQLYSSLDGPPAVSIAVSPSTVARGEPFTVRVEGTDDRGLASVWWWGDQTGDGDLDKAHWNECSGSLSCSQSWSVSTQTPGVLTLCANSRDTAYPTPGKPHQASEGLGTSCTQIEVVSASAGCSGVEVGGYCWHLGPDSASCDAVCAAYGGYSEATRTYAGSDGTSGSCRQIIGRLQVPLDEFFETYQGGIGCFVIQNTSGNYFGYWDQHPTTAAATYGTPGRQRICACRQ